jgi:hypothetical protein
MVMRGSQLSEKKKAEINNDRSFKFDRSEPADKFTSTKQQEPNAKELQISSIR